MYFQQAQSGRQQGRLPGREGAGGREASYEVTAAGHTDTWGLSQTRENRENLMVLKEILRYRTDLIW